MKKTCLFLLSLCIVFACSTSKKTTEKSAKQPGNNKTFVADGSSFDKAIIIKEYSESTGIKAEYQWLKENYPGYKLKQQSLSNLNNKPYDVMDIITSEGENKTIYFDISNFFGKY